MLSIRETFKTKVKQELKSKWNPANPWCVSKS